MLKIKGSGNITQKNNFQDRDLLRIAGKNENKIPLNEFASFASFPWVCQH